MRSFEDDPTLEDLLTSDEKARLLGLLSAISGSAIALSAEAGNDAEPVEFNLETLGYLQAGLPPARRKAAARLVEFILRYVGKYRLAANLHHDTTEASFAELQRRNEALQISEMQYRTLSEQLAEKVEAQVEVIRQTQQQLYESARLRSVGQLAAGVAHEINNPIGFIASNLRVAADYLDEFSVKLAGDPDAALLLGDFRELVNESSDGAQRIAAIVADLKTFSSIDQAEFTPCDLSALMEATVHLVQSDHPFLDVGLHLNPLPSLMGYPAKLSQVFYNVLDNAAKAVAESGHIRIDSRETDGFILITIEDSGCGIPEDILPQVFDPFFTTRGVGSGTGLGLSVARDIVTAHQGEIVLAHRDVRGTRVTLRFPVN